MVEIQRELNILDLPPELLLRIFGLVINTRRNLFTLALVSKKFNEISSDDTIWKHIYFPKAPQVNIKAAFLAFKIKQKSDRAQLDVATQRHKCFHQGPYTILKSHGLFSLAEKLFLFFFLYF